MKNSAKVLLGAAGVLMALALSFVIVLLYAVRGLP